MKVIKQRTETIYVWKHVHLERSRILLFFTLLVLAFMLFILNTRPYSQMGLLLIPLSYGLGVYTYRKLTAWRMGAEGEIKVINELSSLSDGYLILNNVVVPPNWGDADHIILGPNGIFVIETKTLRGNVSCDGDSWRRHKKSTSGFQYPVPIGNPSGQAKRNAKSLKDLLLKHEFDIFKKGAPHIWVHALVCFTREEIQIDIKNPTVEVLKPKQLIDFIVNQKLKHEYSLKELERMGSVILRECS